MTNRVLLPGLFVVMWSTGYVVVGSRCRTRDRSGFSSGGSAWRRFCSRWPRSWFALPGRAVPSTTVTWRSSVCSSTGSVSGGVGRARLRRRGRCRRARDGDPAPPHRGPCGQPHRGADRSADGRGSRARLSRGHPRHPPQARGNRRSGRARRGGDRSRRNDPRGALPEASLRAHRSRDRKRGAARVRGPRLPPRRLVDRRPARRVDAPDLRRTRVVRARALDRRDPPPLPAASPGRRLAGLRSPLPRAPGHRPYGVGVFRETLAPLAIAGMALTVVGVALVAAGPAAPGTGRRGRDRSSSLPVDSKRAGFE